MEAVIFILSAEAEPSQFIVCDRKPLTGDSSQRTEFSWFRGSERVSIILQSFRVGSKKLLIIILCLQGAIGFDRSL